MPPELRILLVDDSSADALITSKVLERNKPDDISVSITQHSRISEARQALESATFDCVLLDLHLPDGRGSENVLSLREISPDVPIVVLSGSEGPHIEDSVLESGASAFVMKQPLSQADDIYTIIADAIKAADDAGNDG